MRAQLPGATPTYDADNERFLPAAVAKQGESPAMGTSRVAGYGRICDYDDLASFVRTIAHRQANRFAPQTTRFAVDSAGNATMFVHRGGQAIKVSSHAARRMTQRGISIDAVESTLGHSPFQYFHQGVRKTGYYDPVARTFVGTVDDTITTVIRNASPNYTSRTFRRRSREGNLRCVRRCRLHPAGR